MTAYEISLMALQFKREMFAHGHWYAAVVLATFVWRIYRMARA